MQMNKTEFRLCPKCGSTESLEDYPAPGMSICVKCGAELIKIPLTEISEDRIYEQDCSFCGAEGEEGDDLFDNGFVVVYKCKKCGTIDGYSVVKQAYDSGDSSYDGNYSYETIKIAQKEGTPNLFSAAKYKEIAKALKKQEKDAQEQNKRYLFKLEKEKTPLLLKIGVRKETIKEAIFSVQNIIEKTENMTQKHINILFAAKILQLEEHAFRTRDIPKKLANESNISEITNVDRKTLRKWKNLLKEKYDKTKLSIQVHKQDGESDFALIDIPDDIAEVVKLDQPYVGECQFSLKNCRLEWRIKYQNETWSDISQNAYELFKQLYWEHKGTLNLQ